MTTMEVRRANKDLQRKLRRLVDISSIAEVSAQFGIGREAIARYLADLPLRLKTFLDIEEASIGAQPPAPHPSGGDVRTMGGVRRANKDLQRKLRRMIDFESLSEVSLRFGIGRAAIAKYLADVSLQPSTFIGIETSIAAAELRIATNDDK